MSPDPIVIQRFESADGRHRVIIMLLTNGHYSFEEDTKHPGDEYTGEYFAPTHISGLYITAEAAERDARATLPWLRDISN
jgi:hypothetical protein